MHFSIGRFRGVPKAPRLRNLNIYLWLCFIGFLYASVQIFTIPQSLEQGLQRLFSNYSSSSMDGFQRFSNYSSPSMDEFLYSLLKIDPSVFKPAKLSSDEMAAQVEKKTPNLPFRFWLEVKGQDKSKNASCAKFPSLYDLKYVNIHWQEVQTVDGPYYLFGAYFDNRTLAKDAPTVRLVGLIAKMNRKATLFCQLWFREHKEPAFAPVSDHTHLSISGGGVYKDGIIQPYMFSCPVPDEYKHTVPQAVSVVENPCDMATTNLKVNYILPPSGQKEGFAVCVKGVSLPFNDYSVRLIEWLELLFILGVDKVFLYNFDMHPNVTKVLSYYEGQGRVEITNLPLPGRQPSAFGLMNMFLKFIGVIKEHQETIPYNDCYLKNIYRYKYISALDIDEIIIPKVTSSWGTLMESIVTEALRDSQLPPSNYVFRNVYFLDDMGHSNETVPNIPRYMHMLQHLYRSPIYTKPGHYIKSLFDTERVLTIHNHYPFTCIGGNCWSYNVNTSAAHLQHYRHYCVPELASVCEKEYKNNSVLDESILKFKEPLILGVAKTMMKLGFINSSSYMLK
ncbi:uncharacterized protein LOC135197717 [Macrobrachium nipponense]|uniref:uncharacterized protein LOC135197717 n=1 Tax=Macrobrachium nipponense TaxID=159736 RepID=UPI0030C8C452